jgi:hypothetical protein
MQTEAQLQNDVTWIIHALQTNARDIETLDLTKFQKQSALLCVQRDILRSLQTVVIERLRILQKQPNT